MQRSSILSAVVLSLCLAGTALADGANIDKVNGAIRVESGQTAGTLSTVNGSIHLGDEAHATSASTVNGSIELGARSGVDKIDTVNGSIRLGAEAKVGGSVSAVNGSVSLAKGAGISGHVSNVNGRITLDAAHIGGGIETVGGDIEVGADSRVEGGILVDKSNSWFNWFSRNPRVVIGPRAVVDGKLEFRRDVDLLVSDSATIGAVSGAKVQKFSGAQP